MAIKGFSQKPSPYPRAIFHGIRITQLISSIIVTSILGYFAWWLRHDGFPTPWTFITLLSVASFTIASTLGTAFFYHMRSLKPSLSLYINMFLSALWVMGFASLTWWITKLLSDQCSTENGSTAVAVMVCKMYKAVESFSAIGTLSTLASLALDMYVIRETKRSGEYNAMGLAAGRSKKGAQRLDDNHDEFSHDMHDEHRGFEEPELEIPEYSHEVKRPYKAQRPIEVSSFGYQVPSEQTSYDSPSIREDHQRYDSGA